MKEAAMETTPARAGRRSVLNFLLTLTTFMSAVCAPAAGRAAAPPAGGADCDEACRKQLAEARAATAKYHDVDAALADGFVPVGPCVQGPGLAGAMGAHYANFSRLFDASVNAAEPEILLYAPDGLGGQRLVALEYFVPSYLTASAPELFGREFDGPMPGHGPGEPAHYDLHVWAWRHNPAGTFAPFNPKVSCGRAGGSNRLGGGEGGFPGF